MKPATHFVGRIDNLFPSPPPTMFLQKNHELRKGVARELPRREHIDLYYPLSIRRKWVQPSPCPWNVLSCDCFHYDASKDRQEAQLRHKIRRRPTTHIHIRVSLNSLHYPLRGRTGVSKVTISAVDPDNSMLLQLLHFKLFGSLFLKKLLLGMALSIL